MRKNLKIQDEDVTLYQIADEYLERQNFNEQSVLASLSDPARTLLEGCDLKFVESGKSVSKENFAMRSYANQQLKETDDELETILDEYEYVKNSPQYQEKINQAFDELEEFGIIKQDGSKIKLTQQGQEVYKNLKSISPTTTVNDRDVTDFSPVSVGNVGMVGIVEIPKPSIDAPNNTCSFL